MRSLPFLLLLLLTLTLTPALTTADKPPYTNNTAYDTGALGPYPHQTYTSSPLTGPRLNYARRTPSSLQHPPRRRAPHTLLALRGDAVRSARGAGPVLLDAGGALVWFGGETWPDARNLRVQEYRLGRYLTFWAGGRSGRGYYYMLDSSYKEVLKIRAQGAGLGACGDEHELLVTRKGTAVLVVYEKRRVDLSPVSRGRKSGWIWDCLFEEMSLDTRKVLFRWRASDVFALNDSYAPLEGRGTYSEPWDWFHLNSVDKDEATGNYLISARYTNSVACISGRDGSIMWRLGGKRSDFAPEAAGDPVSFALQHDARWHGNSTISLFDNSVDEERPDGASRGLLISIDADKKRKTAQALQQFVHPDHIASFSGGNMQVLPDGNVLIGWGSAGAWTEFAPDGSVVEDVRFQPRSQLATGNAQSCGTYKTRWQGYPKTQPSVVIKKSAAYVSWNGATEVNHWRLQCAKTGAVSKASDWIDIVSEERQGFETVLDFDEERLKKWVRVVAFDADMNVLGISRTLDWRSARKSWPQSFAISGKKSVMWYLLLVFCVLLILLRISRRWTRRFYHWRSSQKRSRSRSRSGVANKLWRKNSPRD